ncbi:MAG: hypothetical protein JNL30_20180 [Rubrivivax sp.]|nr:hypothetical protein [Rubrivivax sp.]
MNALARRIAQVAWPAFVTAGVTEMVVFAFVEPAALHAPGGSAIGLSATAVYSIAFFVFWALASLGCLLALRLARSADELNGPGDRPA